jgi:quercetin dioxygenase-like cupin family protein
MRNPLNAIDPKMQTLGNVGYVYDGKDETQMAFWTSNYDIISQEYVHDFEEYVAVVQGQYTLIINDEEFILRPGDEYFIPKGVPHSGKTIKGTRAIYAFGGKRAKRINAESK